MPTMRPIDMAAMMDLNRCSMICNLTEIMMTQAVKVRTLRG